MASDERIAETFDAADPAAVDNQNREAKRRAREDADVLRAIMHSRPGRAWLHRMLEGCHIYASTFAPGQSDLTAFQLGEENVGKKLMLAAQDASVDLYMQMIKEQRDEQRRLDEVRRTERKNREKAEAPAVAAEGFVNDLPPPAGWPGGPPLPKPDAPAGDAGGRGKRKG